MCIMDRLLKITLVFAATSVLSVVGNLALGKDAFQSSELYGGTASRAVDGNAASNFADNSCTHTQIDNDANPYWGVDLGADYLITHVEILNREDCCYPQKLHKFEVIVGDNREDPTGVQCGFHEAEVGRGATVTITCASPTVGRYVYIQKQDPGLVLCEVRVFGSNNAPDPVPVPTDVFELIGCEEGWQRIDKICYHVTPQGHNWTEAKTACEELGATMIMPQTKCRLGLIQNLLLNDLPEPLVWLGGEEVITTIWVDGRTIDEHLFENGYPFDGVKGVVFNMDTNALETFPEMSLLPLLCEKPITSVGPC